MKDSGALDLTDFWFEKVRLNAEERVIESAGGCSNPLLKVSDVVPDDRRMHVDREMDDAADEEQRADQVSPCVH